MVTIRDVKLDLYTGEYGEAFADYIDSNDYICDLVNRIADDSVDIYDYNLVGFVSNHPEYMNSVVSEGLYDVRGRDYDFYDHARCAQYQYIDEMLCENLRDSLLYAALTHIQHNFALEELSDDTYDQVIEIADDYNSDERMCEFIERINEVIDESIAEIEGDDLL